MANEQIFTWEGISLPSYWGGNWGSATADVAFDQIRDTGASSVAIIPNFYMDNKTSNTMGLRANQSETLAQTKAAMLDVTSRGMNVMLKPHVESGDGTWRAEIAPSDPNLWFANYKAMMLQYAALAQETHAPLFCIGTEMKSMSGAAYRDKWVDLIDSIRGVYDGQITYAATYDEAKSVSFWDKVDLIGVDAYVPLTTSNAPTVDQLVKAWTETPVNDYVKTIYQGKSVVETYQALSEQYGKKILFTEVGYRSLDGTNKDPGVWSGNGTVDQQEQTDAYEALFKVMTTYGGQWLDGAFLWSYHPFEHPTDAGIHTDDYTTQDKPANAVIVANYSSPAHVTGLTRTGTASGDKLDGGYHNDVLNGAGGNDVLWGGAGHDLLNGGDGNDTLTGGRGDDLLQGGAGDNQAVFSGAKASYTIVKSTSGTVTISDLRADQDGTDVLTDIRYARFSDQTVDLLAGSPATTPTTTTPTPTPSTGGTLVLQMRGTAGTDKLVGNIGNNVVHALSGNDWVDGGDGNDTLWGEAGNDKLYGGNHNDILRGGLGNDSLSGGAGNDQLWGESGKNALSGGAGRDVFVFNAKPSAATIDRIADFIVKDDSVYLDNAVFKKLGGGTLTKPGKLNKAFFTIGSEAKDKNDYLVYDGTKKTLFYDVDGSGAGKAVAIVSFAQKQKLTALDFFII
ncbi:glycoside hydrolase family 113 [Microvirga antarctica]|uniref:glycoside hydrolase family 113 n=1 Tax=Microvirga antarctica TaxID=2819233 RepID=UPI001B315E0E|nr:hypothetical protein [Microvirga antarctica]